MNHTPGTWEAKSFRGHYSVETDAYVICEINADDYNPEDAGMLGANATLIAAAPELLEALQFCQSVIKSQGMFDLSERMAYDKASAAIAKAIGEKEVQS